MIARDVLLASRALSSPTAICTRNHLIRQQGASSSAPSLRRRQYTAVASDASSDAAVLAMPSPPAPVFDCSQAAASIASRFRGRTCLVQGASRGLGLEFVRQLLDVPDMTVFAACRSPSTAIGLHQLQQKLQQQQQQEEGIQSSLSSPSLSSRGSLSDGGTRRLHVIHMDVCDDTSIQWAADEVSALVPSLDLLVNCSAVLHGPGGMAPETSYSRIRGDQMALSFATNAIGPMLVCRSLLPLLLRSAGATEQQPAIIANMSARVGSLGDNRLGGWYSYRASKAALNQMSLTLSLELRRKRAAAAVVMLHPGTCDTDLSRPYHRNVPPDKLFDRPRAVRQLLGILARLNTEDSGRFIAWDGQDVPW